MLLVSACLVGVKCKYNGRDNSVPELVNLVAEGKVIPVCPEQLGGLATPREPAEIQGGAGTEVLAGRARVLTKTGKDVTDEFIRGARETARLAELAGASFIIFKERSPSCGSVFIYDGTFQGNTIPGEGVATAFLREKGFDVFSENNFHKLVTKDC